MTRFVSVGEIVVDLFGGRFTSFTLGFSGFAREMALLMRRRLDASWDVDFFTALGDDIYSQAIVDDFATNGVGVGHIAKVEGRTVGLSLIDEDGTHGPAVTEWRAQSAARLVAENPALMAAAFADAKFIYVTGATFAIIAPRARGRLLRALHEARGMGAKIVFTPHERPDLWTSARVRGSAFNAVGMVADIVFTDVVGERGTFEEAGPEAIAARYHEWGASEILVYAPGKDLMHSTLEMGIRWLDVDPSLRADLRNSAYLAARIAGASSSEAAAAISRNEPRD